MIVNSIHTKFLVILGACFFFFSSMLLAQQDTEQDIDLNVVIQGNAELFLNDANKVSKVPKVIESSVELTPMVYSLIPRKPTQKIDLKPVPAAKVTIDKPLPKLFRAYAKGAVGTKFTGLGELRFMDGYNRNGTFDSHIKYFTSDGFVSQADSIADSFSDLSIGLTGKRFLKKHSMGIAVDYDREKIHYYGYDPDIFPENFEVDDKRIYKTFSVGANMRSYQRDTTKMNYRGSFDFKQFSDNVQGVENNFIVGINLNKFVESETYALGVDLDYNQFKHGVFRSGAELKHTNTVFTLNPTVTTHRNGLMVKVGAKLTANGADGTQLKVYPDLEARYSLFDGIFIPYAGLGGELHRNRYRTISRENPFVQSFLVDDLVNSDVLRNTNEKINIYGGIRGNISSDMSFNAKISRASFDDFIYYANDSLVTNGNRFRTEYGELTRTTITGELTYNAGDKIKFFGRGDFFIYDERKAIETNREPEEAWNQPNNKIAISASYNIEKKLIAELEIAALGKRRAKSLVEIVDLASEETGGELVTDGSNSYFAYTLDPFVDVTLKGEYRYTKRLSVFVQINNMIAGKYQRFNAYPVQRFNLMGGATYSF
jgi:hypothetical protein